MQTVLGIDVGTQSVKVVCYDFGRRTVVGTASSPLDVERDKNGKAEQNANDWLVALEFALGQLSSEIKQTIVALAVSGQQHGFVPVSAEGQVLAPVKLWCDTATQLEVEHIVDECGGSHQVFNETGNTLVAGFTASKIRWLKNNNVAAYKRMNSIMLPHDYVNFVLTGNEVMEFGDASGTGLLNVHARAWSKAMLSAVDGDRDLMACLPSLVPPDHIVGSVNAKSARRFGIPQGCIVAVGGGDNMMAAIGTGNVSDGILTMSLGSSGTVFAYSSNPIVDPLGDVAAFCSSTGGWLPLLCTMNCTLSTEIIRSTFNLRLDDFDKALLNADVGAGGLRLFPFFNGERTPNLPNSKGTLLGMNASNVTQVNLLRATVEGVTFGLKLGVDRLQQLGINANEIILTGGGSNSAVWRQIISDVCQLPVTVLQQDEGAAFGAALQALWLFQRQSNPALSIRNITEDHLSVAREKCAKPSTDTVEHYRQLYIDYQRQLALIAQLYKSEG